MYKLNKQQIILIVLLFSLLLSLFLGKKENFTETERKAALDGLTTQNKLFNSVFSKISNTDIEVNKNTKINKNLDINENTKINKNLTVGGDFINNGIKFTKKWSGYPDRNSSQAEISNDTSGYKALMIVGNKSGGGKRRVRIYDELCIGSTCLNEEHIKLLTGKRHMYIQSSRGGHLSDQGGWKGKGSWEKMYIRL